MADARLAQVNVARMLAPTDDPAMAKLVANLEPINALADAAPGFMWRLQAEGGNATSLRVFDDTLITAKMSVWTSVEALKEYVYKSRHVDFLRRRKAWFERYVGMHNALGWIPAERVPSVGEAKERLEHRERCCDTETAFLLQKVFEPALIESTV